MVSACTRGAFSRFLSPFSDYTIIPIGSNVGELKKEKKETFIPSVTTLGSIYLLNITRH